MSNTTTHELAHEIIQSILFSKHAHIHNPKTENDTVRFWDNLTPYIVHPIWCAMTLLTETTLDGSLRFRGYQALLWHDVLEDTLMNDLPENTDQEVRDMVRDMTFANFEEEKSDIWSKSETIRLLKLYDKVSNLLDGVWMSDQKWNKYVQYTLELVADVENNFSGLNIVKIARSVCIPR